MYPCKETKATYIRHSIAAPVIALLFAFAGSLGVYAQASEPETATPETPAVTADTPAVTADEPVSDTPRRNRPVRPQRRPTSPISEMPDSISLGRPSGVPVMVVGDSLAVSGDSLALLPVDSVMVVPSEYAERRFEFMPDPTKAVWMSALFPGLGQLYNRRYWKLPIVIGAFMGLGYATSWNNTMLRDYTTAYSDIMDNDPTTKSYMDFFAPTVKEEDLDHAWLTSLLRTRKNYFRRNRDLCIICMVGVYLLAMVDAYVDAQLAHFDISPSLSMDVAPALMNNDLRNGSTRPSLGLYWALNF
ncbi:MAG: DUF5683 domain-containing protein [Duncaniella sp.]|nr:DUF5683 domain-containing protein [Duncaniella sp.]